MSRGEALHGADNVPSAGSLHARMIGDIRVFHRIFARGDERRAARESFDLSGSGHHRHPLRRVGIGKRHSVKGNRHLQNPK
jgi:hypothetical protein